MQKEISTRAGVWTILGVTAVLMGIMFVQYAGFPRIRSYEKPETHVLTPVPTIVTPSTDWVNDLIPQYLDPLLIHNGWVYHNTKGRYSIMLPKQVINFDAGCAQSGSIVRTYDNTVDIKAFEKEDSVVIAPARHFVADEDTATCTEVIHTPENVSDEAYYKWTIYSFPARNEQDVTRWMQEHIGAGCEVVDAQPSALDGVEDLTMTMVLDSDEKPCYTNVINYMFLSRSAGRAVYIRSGQEPVFLWTNDQANSYENQMLATFRIE
jgi:hypothetical protein